MSEIKGMSGKWEINGATSNGDYLIQEIQDDGDSTIVAACEFRNDADYICRVVNCHERLVGIARFIHDFHPEIEMIDDVNLDDLIAEAEGGVE